MFDNLMLGYINNLNWTEVCLNRKCWNVVCCVGLRSISFRLRNKLRLRFAEHSMGCHRMTINRLRTRWHWRLPSADFVRKITIGAFRFVRSKMLTDCELFNRRSEVIETTSAEGNVNNRWRCNAEVKSPGSVKTCLDIPGRGIIN
ncbi:MAG: hypothetical protein ACTS4T_00835 [Candidatus Hodgkinia cicadicola]